MKVDTKWLVILGILFSALLFGQYWAGAQWRSQQGPDLLAVDHQGNLYIGLHSIILRYAPDGKFLGQRDLKTLGIETHVGGIAFFPDGDFLMVPQNYNPSFMQRLLINYRITTPMPVPYQEGSGRLSRCSWDKFRCEPLPGLSKKFDQAFWVDIDKDENVFLADVSQHTIYWLDKNGRELDRIANNPQIQFPNQIRREGDFLWIANCNDNSLSRISLGNSQFHQSVQRFPLKDLRLPASDRWPIGIVPIGGDYMVLAKGGNLMHGSIVRMDSNGVIQDIFGGGGQTDYIAIAAVNDEIFAADYASLSIKRYSKYGALNGEFNAPEYIQAAVEYKVAMTKYQRVETYFSWLFWSALVLGSMIALWLEWRHKNVVADKANSSLMDSANAHFMPQANDQRIQWLVYRFFYRSINKWLIWFWAPFLILILPMLFSAEEESVKRSSAILLTHGIGLLFLINTQRLTRKQLGALVPWVFIRQGKHVSGAKEQDIYSYKTVGAVILMVGSEDILVSAANAKPIFEGKLAQEYILRLIEKAQPLTLWQRLRWLLDHKFSSVLWLSLLTLLYLMAILATHLHQIA